MDGYIIVDLKEFITEKGEDYVKGILSNFSCPLNKDVESFLKSRAIDFAKQSISPTRLVFVSFRGAPVLVGYYTISANKVICVPKDRGKLNSDTRRRLKKFAQEERFDAFGQRVSNDMFIISAPLIAQLGKNFANGYNELISGDILLHLAEDTVRAIQRLGGGQFAYLECEEKNKLIEFYESNGYVNFGKRMLDRDERDTQMGTYLIQMLKHIK